MATVKLWRTVVVFNQQFTRRLCSTSSVIDSGDLYSSVKPKKLRKPTAEGNAPSFLLDCKRVKVKGGDGGNGCMSFLSLFRKEFAGPDGGDGGNGAHIIFQASPKVKSLNHLTSAIKGKPGNKGQSKDCHGKNAEHQCIPVPLGTVFKDPVSREVVAELPEEGAMYVAARGGAGGKGNHFFLSNENRAPMVAETGGSGEEREIVVEMRTMAHAGMVGFPNAGKSTLLRALSRARPKVAAYPFTTLRPHVGVIEYEDNVQVSVADLPGLICGAHENHGLGISFLRHIERCVCLLYVLDLSVKEPWTQFEELKFELEQYQAGLSQRPHAIIANKLDLPYAEESLRVLREKIPLPVFGISAKTKINVDLLILHLRKLYDDHYKNLQ